MDVLKWLALIVLALLVWAWRLDLARGRGVRRPQRPPSEANPSARPPDFGA